MLPQTRPNPLYSPKVQGQFDGYGVPRINAGYYIPPPKNSSATDLQGGIYLPWESPSHRRFRPLVIMFTGRRGTGKSLSATALSYMDLQANRQRGDKDFFVASNFFLKFAEVKHPFIVDEIQRFPDWAYHLLLCIDEIATQFPGRKSMRTIQLDFSMFLTQIRKRRIELLMTTQFPQIVDVQILMQVDLFVQTEFHYVLSPDGKRIGICDLYIHDWWGQWTGRQYKKVYPPAIWDYDWHRRILNVQKMFDQYDTDEVVAPSWSPQRLRIAQSQGWLGIEDAMIEARAQEVMAEQNASKRTVAAVTEFNVEPVAIDSSKFTDFSDFLEHVMREQKLSSLNVAVYMLEAARMHPGEIQGYPHLRPFLEKRGWVFENLRSSMVVIGKRNSEIGMGRF